MQWYKHYLGDYARDTAHLSLLEHGAYRVLLDAYYATGKPLPADKHALYRICTAFTAAERKAVDSVADQFFQVNGDGSRHNQRADREIASAQAFAESQAMRAQSGWHKRRQSSGNDPAMPPASAGQSSGNAYQNQIPEPQPEPEPTDSSLRSESFGLKKDKSSKTLAPTSQARHGARRKRVNEKAPTAAVWKAYAAAYSQRYGVEPVPNGMVNGQLANFIARIPANEAPLVAEFYVRHNAAFYVRKRHPVGLLLQDAEGLRTQWATGRIATGLEARSAEEVDDLQAQIERVGRELEGG